MQGDFLERRLERKNINPFFLIAFFAVSIVALLFLVVFSRRSK